MHTKYGNIEKTYFKQNSTSGKSIPLASALTISRLREVTWIFGENNISDV